MHGRSMSAKYTTQMSSTGGAMIAAWIGRCIYSFSVAPTERVCRPIIEMSGKWSR